MTGGGTPPLLPTFLSTPFPQTSLILPFITDPNNPNTNYSPPNLHPMNINRQSPTHPLPFINPNFPIRPLSTTPPPHNTIPSFHKYNHN